MLVHRFIVLGSLPLVASAAFTQQACWQRNCLTRNDAGTLCFVPSAHGEPLHTCKDEVLAHLLGVHVNSSLGVSTAYYNERAFLVGTSSFPVRKASPSPLFVCMSGRDAYADGVYRTLCRLAVRDDDFLEVNAHARECWINVAQRVVTDGCYTPMDIFNTSKPPRKWRYSFVHTYSTARVFVLLYALAVVVGVCIFAVRYRSTRANHLSAAGRIVGRWIKRTLLATAIAFPRARTLTTAFLFLLSFTIPGFEAYAHASTVAEPAVLRDLEAASELGSAVRDIGIGSSTA